MYAGNLRTTVEFHNNYFFWLFPQPQTQTPNAPLILYLNGGPGSTSMNALFMENGPLRVRQLDPTDPDSFEVTYEPENSSGIEHGNAYIGVKYWYLSNTYEYIPCMPRIHKQNK